ncbi:rod shape-determining protein RodA [Urechidicola croceus]|uniref:Cell wall polymerase n=1 Tax=Urechidicola croceus TaxID=1850246 RepID=A0A1D8PAP2_9FLAO|nr:rod shape-determining protein RodA [Urechidicola croceus]AOW21654.1 rod shape-determining protein RodA [Urechidicola croceus]
MQREKNNIFAGVDLWLVSLFIILVFLGWLNIYAASTSENHYEILDFGAVYGKQIIWIGLTIPLITIVLFIETRFYERFSSIFYIVSLLSLVGLFVFGKNINGATSWYAIGSSTLQPSEFAKAFTALAVAKLLSDTSFTFRPFKNHIKAFFIIFLPAFLITLQPDPGSGIVYLAFFFVFYREGLPLYYFIIGFFSIAIFLFTLKLGSYLFFPIMIPIVIGLFVLFIIYMFIYKTQILKRNWLQLVAILLLICSYIFSIDYIFNNVFQQRHRDRFNILLGKTTDTQGIGYNTTQALKTIASGGFNGKGYLDGDRTQGKFVPEQDTDYIFSTVGEEWGFIGSTIVIILFIALMLRIIHVAERQKSSFSRIYGYSIASIFFIHFTVNVGMVMGLLPTIGIPLPFFSYGGSSLWGFTLLLFIFIRLDANRAYEW